MKNLLGKKISTAEAKKCAREDMRNSGLSLTVVDQQKTLLSQPVLTERIGLVGLQYK